MNFFKLFIVAVKNINLNKYKNIPIIDINQKNRYTLRKFKES